jgi:NADH-quinone oxidoreductase subunit F
MPKVNSTNELKDLKNRIIADHDTSIPTIVISAGTCGQASGANDLIRIAKRELIANGLTNRIHLRITGCHGFCEMEPSVLIEPSRIFYPKVTTNNMSKIIKSIYREEILEDLLFKHPETGKPIIRQDEIPFYSKQKRLLLAMNEKIDPIRLFKYLEVGGYDSFIKALEKEDPHWVIEEVKLSGLRGRGGGGFPTGQKWEMLAAQRNGKEKYLVCNADEGDPGAYMDRSLLEGNPHSIIEGMLIGAYATGATNGIVYVRNEYPLAIKHLIIALRLAREYGLLGENILGTGFSFDVDIVRGAGAFVCGEETALIRSVEGKMGEPRQRPPFPIEKGIYGKPTAINNVETWANVPIILKLGSKEYSKIGTVKNSGTKIFSLVGKVKNTGLVEVPMGISIKEIIFDIGGGASSGAKIKAVQTGGPSGGCIPIEKFNLPIDYDSLSAAGSIMGSGGMIVMDERTCMVDLAKYFTSFLKDESCGKCFVCRKGTQRMYELLEDISMGLGTIEKLDLLEELANVVKDSSMCGLGQTAANPVLSTIKYYRHEYLEHIINKKCRAGVCRDLVGAPCQSACPIGTEAWRYIAHIAVGEYEKAYTAIREANPFPSVCARVCSHPCEYMCRSGTSGGQSIAIRALKRFITDQIDPSTYKPVREKNNGKSKFKVAIIGSGPAGLTAAHYLSLKGYKITVFEKDEVPGGMLTTGIPSYRLPREVINKEIDALIDKNVSLKTNSVLGRDFTIDELFELGYHSVFLAMGAHKSKLLNIEGEDLEGVYPAIEFLKEFNLHGKNLAKGRVGVIGGGDSAIDAARVSLRQKDVKSVTLLYRRTRQEMPALQHEIDAAIEEGVNLVTLVSPIKIHSENDKLSGVEFIKNKLGDVDSSGRRNPVPIPGSEEFMFFDTLIITIGDTPDVDYISSMNINVSKWGTLIVDEDTLQTNRDGVFAGGDVVTGPNTVVDAIAAGKKAAKMIDRYLLNEELNQPPEIRLPKVYVPQVEVTEEDTQRVTLPTIPVEQRKSSLNEVELTLSEEQARHEAHRCMRCDLEFIHEQKDDKKIELIESEDIYHG